MKYLIFSDIHGNYESFQRFMKEREVLDSDSSICLGDILHEGVKNGEDDLVTMLRNMKDAHIVQGNHDKDYNGALKSRKNRAFLQNLPMSLKLDNILAFHSSMEQPGMRLYVTELLEDEIKYLDENHPDSNMFLFGHTHLASVFSYDKEKNEILDIEPGINIQLDERLKYFINPGALSLTYMDNTFATLDTSKNLLDFYTLEELSKLYSESNENCLVGK